MNELQYKTIQLTVLREVGWCFYFSFLNKKETVSYDMDIMTVFTEHKSTVYIKYMYLIRSFHIFCCWHWDRSEEAKHLQHHLSGSQTNIWVQKEALFDTCIHILKRDSKGTFLATVVSFSTIVTTEQFVNGETLTLAIKRSEISFLK